MQKRRPKKQTHTWNNKAMEQSRGKKDGSKLNATHKEQLTTKVKQEVSNHN